MVTDTSLDAFRDIRKQLGYRQSQVLFILMKHGAKTNLEISVLLHVPINQITPRTNELVKKGHIIEGDKKECSISKRVVSSWKVK